MFRGWLLQFAKGDINDLGRVEGLLRRPLKLLQDPRLTVKRVASLCGFCDEFHFARRFKVLTGLTPAQSRRR